MLFTLAFRASKPVLSKNFIIFHVIRNNRFSKFDRMGIEIAFHSVLQIVEGCVVGGVYHFPMTEQRYLSRKFNFLVLAFRYSNQHTKNLSIGLFQTISYVVFKIRRMIGRLNRNEN